MAEDIMLPRTHPGKIIKTEFLEPLGVTPYRLAKEMRVPPTRIADILAERRGITADTALRLSRVLGCTPEFWLNLQASYDLAVARQNLGTELGEMRCLNPNAVTSEDEVVA